MGSDFLIYLDTELDTECMQKIVVSATQNTFRLYSVISYCAVFFKVQFSLVTEDVSDTSSVCDL